MALIELEGDVLTGDAEALIIAVDGQHPKMLGNIGQRFMAQVIAQNKPGEDHWARIVREARYPINEGIAHLVNIDFLPETEFKYLIFMAMYNHYNDADPESRLRMNWAYANAVGAAYTAASPAWRQPSTEADLEAMTPPPWPL